MNLKRLNRSVVCLLATAAALSACSSTTVSSPDGKGTVKIEGNGTTYTATTTDGSFTMTAGASAKFPSSFVLPQYPGSTCQMTVDSKMNGKTGAGDSVMLVTSDSIAKVIDHYKSWLESNGWKIDAAVSMDANGMLSASKGPQTATVAAVTTAKESGSETSITLAVQSH